MPDFNEPSETQKFPFDTSATRQELNELSRLGRQFSTTLITAFDGIAVKGKGLNEVLRSLALSLSQLVLKAALQPLGKAFGGLLQNLFTGGLGFAKGGVLQGRMPVPFASGGVIASPVTFPLAGGRLGLAGERGAEAILPLSRGPDGKLGVRAGGGEGRRPVNITVQVSTPDAESFRRSEAQVSAAIARAVARGNRAL